MPYNEFTNFSDLSAWARNLPENSTSPDDPLALLDKGKVPGKWLGSLWGRGVKNLIYVDRGSVRDRLGVAEKPYRTQSPPDLKHLDAKQREQVLDGLNEAPREQHEDFQKDRKNAETAARQQVVALIEDEYGPEVAAKVFQNTLKDDKHQVSVSQIAKLDDALPAAGHFHDIHYHFKQLATHSADACPKLVGPLNHLQQIRKNYFAYGVDKPIF